MHQVRLDTYEALTRVNGSRDCFAEPVCPHRRICLGLFKTEPQAASAIARTFQTES